METAIGDLSVGSSGTAHASTPRERDARFSALAEVLANGDISALSGIWTLVGDDLFAVALWRSGSVTDAEDVIQEVFVKLAQRPKALRRAKNTRAYILRMARNAAIDLVKKRGRGEKVEIEEDLVTIDPDFARIVDGRRVGAAVALLTPKLREVVLMRHLADLSFREIGSICGIPTFTAASRYRTAITRLRSIMGVSP